MTGHTTVDPTRRDALVGAAAAVVAAVAPSGPVRARTRSISGIVYDPQTGVATGGIAGVMVSNGRDVATTDAAGRYTLPLPDEAVIFVVKPAGYMPPVDPATQLPLFYRIHQPMGTPRSLKTAFAGIEPTAALPESLDFPLRRREEPSTFDVVLFTDPQPASDAEIDFIREDVIEALAGTPAKFGITAGDVMFDDLSLYDRYNRIIGTIGIPWWNIGGNHDLNYEAPNRRYSRETFKRVYGPNYYAFGYGQALFLMLDDVDYLGADRTNQSAPGRYEGRLDSAQLEFARNVLSGTPKDRLVVVVLHIPLRTYLDPESPATNLVNRSDLFALLEGRPHTVSFAGHTHTTEHHYFDAADGWTGTTPHHHHVLTAVSGSWWSGPLDRRGVACADSCDGSPNGFHVLTVDGVEYRTRFVPAKEPNGRQIRLSVESSIERADSEQRGDVRRGLGTPINRSELGYVALNANVFDGGPKTRVSMKIDDRAPIEMTRTTMIDPFIGRLFASNETTAKSWVKAELSSHIWRSSIPDDIAVGAHRIVVSAFTEYGDEVSGALALEVV